MQRIAQLQQMIADFACVMRVPNLADKNRAENDVEHSYGLTLTSWFLALKIAPELDQLKILKYALAHDIVELHAGDTFVFAAQKELDSKNEREDKALELIAKDWPDFSELAQYAKDYKNKVDEEARFVYSIDKLLPVIMVNLGEKDTYWARYQITLEMQMQEKEAKVKVSPIVGPYYEKLVAWMTAPDYFYKDKVN